jgi:hypothetical protein
VALSPAEARLYQDPAHITRILSTVRCIAVVGLSRRPDRPGHFVPAYLQRAGYAVAPVTPHPGPILGEATVPDLLSLREPPDLALVFRPAHECVAVAEQAIRAGIPRVWFQLHIDALAAARLATARGLEVVLDRCMMVEHRQRAV